MREQVASQLGMIIIWTYALSLGACFMFAFINVLKGQDIDANELFRTVAAVTSGPLGFVLGFYFRENRE